MTDGSEDRFDREAMASRAAELASEGIYLGTSSWKYPGWIGSLYDRARYLSGGRFSEKHFRDHCLAEYAEVFPTVCVDAGYYRFPERPALQALADQVPDHFRFAFKAPDTITVRRFPKLARFGARGGERNPHFLDADLFCEGVLQPLEAIRGKVGVVILEFSRFHPGDFGRGAEFVAGLGAFLGKVPAGWRLGVEVRNPSLLRPEYFDALREGGAAHVLNQWSRMPGLGVQLGMAGAADAPFACARLLLREGRSYAEAVKAFAPYERVRDVLPAVRGAARELMGSARVAGRPLFLYANNRLEGNALATLQALARS